MKTIEEIYEIEPRLRAQFAEIPRIMNERNDCVDPFFGNWAKIKRAFSELVGYFGVAEEKPELCSSTDYNTVYRHFFAEAERNEPEWMKEWNRS
jgi:hypothetical protein